MENIKYDHEVVVKAINFATVNHCGGVRKGTDIPYIIHAMEAAVIVATMTSDPDIIAAAVLHDVVEDTHIKIDELKKQFNERICILVASESEDKRENLPAQDTWLIRKEEAIKRIEIANLETKMVALGDKLSNIRAIDRDYRKIGEKLWERFNQKDASKQAEYYRAFKNATSELKDYDAWKEYEVLVEKVFKEM